MSRKIEFGYVYDFRNPPQWRRPATALYAEILDFAAWSESVGFEGAWVPEHHGAEDAYIPSPLPVLAAMAARTSRLKLGSLIALAPLYEPVRFAEDCAVIDILSGGRLEMAVAVGYRRRETDAHGVPFETRGERTDEFLTIVRRLWAGEKVTFQGRHFDIRDAAIAPGPARGAIPLFIGGYSKRALARAARHGDGFHGDVSAWDRYLQALSDEGKPAQSARIRTANLLFFVASDPAAATEELAPYMHYVNGSYAGWLREEQHAGQIGYDERFKPMTLDEFKASGAMKVVTPSRAIEMLTRLHDRAPIEQFAMAIPPGIPLDCFRSYAQLFAEEVAPAFR